MVDSRFYPGRGEHMNNGSSYSVQSYSILHGGRRHLSLSHRVKRGYHALGTLPGYCGDRSGIIRGRPSVAPWPRETRRPFFFCLVSNE